MKIICETENKYEIRNRNYNFHYPAVFVLVPVPHFKIKNMVKPHLIEWHIIEQYLDLDGRRVPEWGIIAFSKTVEDLKFLIQFTNVKCTEYLPVIQEIETGNKEFYPQLN